VGARPRVFGDIAPSLLHRLVHGASAAAAAAVSGGSGGGGDSGWVRPLVPELLRGATPSVRLVAVLRNPSEAVGAAILDQVRRAILPGMLFHLNLSIDNVNMQHA